MAVVSTSESEPAAALWLIWLALCSAFSVVALTVPAVAGVLDEANLIVLGVAAGSIYWAARMRALDRPGRRGIRLIGHALSLALAADVVWFAMTRTGVADPFGSPLEVVYVASSVLLVIGILRVVRSRGSDAVATYDAVVIAGASGALIWSLIVSPVLASSNASPTQVLVGVAFPVLHVIMTAAVLRMILGGGALSPSIIMMLTGLVLFVGADSAFYVRSLTDSGATPVLVDVTYCIALAFVGSAFLHPSVVRLRDRAAAAPKLSRTRLLVLTASATTPLVLVILRPTSTADVVGLACVAIALMVIVLLRSWSLLEIVEDLSRRRVDERFRALVRHSTDAIVVIDTGGVIMTVSDTLARNWKPIEDPAEPGTYRIEHWIDPADRDRFIAFCQQLAAGSAGESTHIRVRMSRGEDWGHAEVVGANLLDTEDVDGIVLTVRDISDRVELEQELRRQAEHDPLTGLANRGLFTKVLEEELAATTGEDTALLLLDVDDFKGINDEMGHPVGDHVLVTFANRLRDLLPPFALAARLGGDEFAVVVPAVSSIGSIGGLAHQIATAMRAPIEIDHHAITVTTSIGIAVATGREDAPDLVRQADAAMYTAKAAGPGRVQRYTSSLAAHAETELALRRGLARAQEAGELSVVYQTIVDAVSGQTRMIEALLRWDHRERGAIPPDVFIPIADSSGLIDDIGMWVLQQACEVGAQCAPTIRTAVNVSLRQLRSSTFVGRVIRLLKDVDLPASSLVLEVGQDALREPQVKNRLEQLRRCGVAIALERFGSDYATLTGLNDLDVDVVKIDQHLLQDEYISPALIEAIIHQAGQAGIDVVIQGVETDDIRAELATSGAGNLQGFAISEPMTEDEVLDGPLAFSLRSGRSA